MVFGVTRLNQPPQLAAAVDPQRDDFLKVRLAHFQILLSPGKKIAETPRPPAICRAASCMSPSIDALADQAIDASHPYGICLVVDRT